MKKHLLLFSLLLLGHVGSATAQSALPSIRIHHANFYEAPRDMGLCVRAVFTSPL